jgi:WG containing repeat
MRWIVPPRFEAITLLPGRAGHMLAKIDGKQGIMGADGGWIVAPVHDDLKPLAEGRYAARIDGKYGVLSSDGSWLVAPSFDDVKPLAEGRIVARVGAMNGVYDTAAKAWVVQPQSAVMCGFQGQYVIGITDRLRTIYNARTGDSLIGPHYNRLWLDFADGLIAVRVADRWGYADLSGDLVIPAQFRNASMFRRGIAWGDSAGKLCPIDRRGQRVEGIPCIEPAPGELDENSLPKPLCGD